MAFLDDPRKGFPTTKGQRLVFGLPGYGKPQKVHSKTKSGDFQAWIMQFAHIQGYTVEETSHENAMQHMKLLQAPYYMAVQSLAKVVKGKLRTMERCLHVGAYTHISNHINESKDFLVNNRMMHFACFIHRRIVSALTRKRALIDREMPPPTMKVDQ